MAAAPATTGHPEFERKLRVQENMLEQLIVFLPALVAAVLSLPIIPKADDVSRVYSMTVLILPKGSLFIADTHVNLEPTAAQLVELTHLAQREVRRFGLIPKVALLSHSNFGASHSPSARRMSEALSRIRAAYPDLVVDGEMHGDAALSQPIRDRLVADSPIEGSANLLIMPSLDAANISLSLLSGASDGLMVGPVLLGMSKPIHVLPPTATARGITNLTALAVAQCGNGLSVDPVDGGGGGGPPISSFAPRKTSRARFWPF
jgi:malate dehydrogenase (oxaloacetate-decarboxylating)(NADP+)